MHTTRSKLNIVILLGLAVGVLCFCDLTPFPAFGTEPRRNPETKGFAGSVSCRECHERFYQLWSTSFHGLAMQPYSDALAQEKLTPQEDDVVVGSFRYRAEIGKGQGWVLEKGHGGTKKYPMEHTLGGKNVFYFLTPLEKGRLQTLPVAYDVNRKEWMDMAASTLRPDEPRYAYTLAYYLHQKGETAEAIASLKSCVEMHPEYRDAQVLLRQIPSSNPKP
jgi:hypothetical protein